MFKMLVKDKRLKWIDSNKIDYRNLQHFDFSAQSQNIQRIQLRKCTIGQRSLMILMKFKWPALTHIIINENGLNFHGICMIIESTKKLTKLNYFGNLLTSKSISTLLCSELTEVQYISLGSNARGDRGIIQLSKIALPKLKSLAVDKNCITNKSVVLIVSMSLPLLQDINLSSNRLTNDSGKALFKSDWPNLQRLNIMGNSLNDDFIKNVWRLQSRKQSTINVSVCHRTGLYSSCHPTLAGFSYLTKMKESVTTILGLRNTRRPFKKFIISSKLLKMVQTKIYLRFTRGNNYNDFVTF